MSSKRQRRRDIRKARADNHAAMCAKGQWKPLALLLGFAESRDSYDYRLIVSGHAVCFADLGYNPWKAAVKWWEKHHGNPKEFR